MNRFELFVDGLGSPGGIAFDDEDNMYVVESSKGQIQQFDADGQRTAIHKTNGHPTSILFDDSGDIFVSDVRRRHILLISPGEGAEVYANQSKGRKFAGPHSMYFTPTGDLLFTDAKRTDVHTSSSGREGGGNDSTGEGDELVGGSIYSVDLDGETSLVGSTTAHPVGLAVSDDGLRLYVSESETNLVTTYEVGEEGALENREVFVQFEDGLTPSFIALDAEGQLYVARQNIGLSLIDPDGKFIDAPELPGSNPAGICFGGLDFDELYVADAETGAVYRCKSDHPGQRPFVGPRSV